jgi:hypothetical protein
VRTNAETTRGGRWSARRRISCANAARDARAAAAAAGNACARGVAAAVRDERAHASWAAGGGGTASASAARDRRDASSASAAGCECREKAAATTAASASERATRGVGAEVQGEDGEHESGNQGADARDGTKGDGVALEDEDERSAEYRGKG